MGDKTVSVRVRFEGGDQVKAGLTEVGREGAKAMQTLGGVSARTGQQLQNAGYQVSDFFVQVAGGTAPTRALAQQLPQLLQGLGLVGVAASVLVAALPSLWSLFSSGADDSKALQAELENVSKAVDAYGQAADLAIEPMDRLIKKYGEQADAVRQVRLQQAELRRGDAVRAVNDLMSNTQGSGGGTGNSSGEIAQALAVEQAYKRIAALQASLTPDQARVFDFTAELTELDRMAASVNDVRTGIAGMAADYGITFEQAASLAVAVDRVRDSAGQSATEQVAAASALTAYLVEVYGSADAANQATGGLVDRLNAAVSAAADVTATADGIAGAVGAGADEAARLAGNLSAAAANYSALSKRTGQSGPDTVRSQQYGAVYLDGQQLVPPVIGAGQRVVKSGGARSGGGGGGGGGADADLARAKALTEGVRTETEKYAQSLDEVNRLKAKGLITDETYNRQLDKLQDKLGEMGDLGQKAASAIKGAFDGLFDDPAESLRNLAKQLAQMALYAGLAKAFPSVFGAGGMVPLGVKGFASGGFHAGGLRIVGENGPELEATGPSMIYPNSALRGMSRGSAGSGTSVQVINNSGQPSRQETSRGPDGRELVRVIVGEEIARGRMDKPMRGRFGTGTQKVIR